ncbi:uncharacterized protein LOC141611061 [Silene latifolia]|uniref:uncharacterized protein LOC141611061 n=1 Tax=Silene latifolia TaxID=37657 RepID=UPI003D76E617
MGSMSGILRRPLYAAAAVAVASISTDLPNKFKNPKLIDPSALHSLSRDSSSCSEASWASHISVSKLANFSFVTRIRVPLPSINSNLIPYCSGTLAGNSVTSSPLLLSLYQSAELSKASKPKTCSYTSKSVPSEDLYRWHLPEPAVVDDKSDCSSVKSRTVVVLLGWLGAKQKHLNKYAEWYTSRGFHAITFTFPMSEVLSYQVGGKAEQDVELLVNHLAEWLEEEHGKNLLIHTFSNTGWLTYGVMLEKFQKQDPSLIGRIKGCIVDSAPVAAPDPQVWASGFSAAFLKKQSVATKGSATSHDDSAEEEFGTEKSDKEPKPAMTETALLAVLGKFFEVVLKLPPVNRRLSDVIGVLSSRQPSCPQLYIYSSADRVIPARSVESFIEQQRQCGHQVTSCDFVSTPHVDHFRNDPQLYTSQLTHFLTDSVLKCCKGSF